jgi:integrase
MATYRKRGQKWQARIQRQDGPPQAKTFLTLQDAKLWARKIEREYDLSLNDLPPKLITLKEALLRYLDEVTPLKKRARIETYRIQAWLKTVLSFKLITQIKTQDLALWRDGMIKKGYQPNTIRLHLAVLSHLFTIAKSEWGFEQLRNPVINLSRPRLPASKDIRITDDNIELIIKNTQSPYLPKLIYLALYSAMRRSELIKLRWEHIDWQRNIIHICDTKNGDNRKIPLFDSIKTILQPMIKESGQVFPIQEQAITVAFKRAVGRSRLNDITFHTLRHEAITRLFEQGYTIPKVAVISGHKSWGMLRRYTHIESIFHNQVD